MTALSPQTALQLQTAQELLKSGNMGGAQDAVARIDAEFQEHPEVLGIRWELAAQAQEWEVALTLAGRLCQAAPENEIGWLWQACSQIELNRVPEALEALLAAHTKFPQSPAIAYNLACCTAKLKRYDDAFQWILKASETGGRAEVKLMALNDPDLDPLLDRICALK